MSFQIDFYKSNIDFNNSVISVKLETICIENFCVNLDDNLYAKNKN